jgi:hypothetical protein
MGKTVYLLAPGVRVEVSRDGAEFKPPAKLKVQMQFPGPVEVTNTTMTFEDGPMRLRVDRTDVIISRYTGQGGTNQFGA